MTQIKEVIHKVWLGLTSRELSHETKALLILETYEDRFSMSIKDLKIASSLFDLDEIDLCFSREDVDTFFWFFSELRSKLRKEEKKKEPP